LGHATRASLSLPTEPQNPSYLATRRVSVRPSSRAKVTTDGDSAGRVRPICRMQVRHSWLPSPPTSPSRRTTSGLELPWQSSFSRSRHPGPSPRTSLPAPILPATDQGISPPGATSQEVATRARLTLVHDQEKARQPQASRPRSSWLESLIDERPPRGHGSTFEGAQTIGHDAQHSRVAEIAFDQPRIVHCPDQETEAALFRTMCDARGEKAVVGSEEIGPTRLNSPEGENVPEQRAQFTTPD